MRRLIAVLLLLSLQQLAEAQNKYHDVIWLKNGSIIKGTIIELKPDESVTVLIGGRETVTFFTEEIAKIGKEGRLTFRDEPRMQGYFSRNEMGVSIRKSHDWQQHYYTILPWFQTVHGYKWNDYLETGLGIGTDFYESVVTIPFFISISGQLSNSKVAPIYVIQYGDSFLLNQQQLRFNRDSNVEAKNFFRIGTGLQINNPTNAFYLSLGFKLNKIVYTDYWWDSYSTTTTRLYRSFTVGFGMKF